MHKAKWCHSYITGAGWYLYCSMFCALTDSSPTWSVQQYLLHIWSYPKWWRRPGRTELGSALRSLFVVEPLRTTVCYQMACMRFAILFNEHALLCFLSRHKLEDEKKTDLEEYKSLGVQFRNYHGGSSFVNLLALLGAFVYAWDLAIMMPV